MNLAFTETPKTGFLASWPNYHTLYISETPLTAPCISADDHVDGPVLVKLHGCRGLIQGMIGKLSYHNLFIIYFIVNKFFLQMELINAKHVVVFLFVFFK